MLGRIWAIAGSCFLASGALAQGPPTGPPPPPRLAAPVDLTGYWVSLVTEDWRHRMMTAPKGDALSVPLNPEGRKMAAAWDPAKDESAGEQCRAYGAPGVMRLPGRLHITWQDDATLKVETDTGTQARILSFRPGQNPSQNPGGDWQGASAATWDLPTPPIPQPFGPPAALGAGGSLKVVTTRMKAGYLRKNGIPYSANTVLTEYWDRLDVPGGDSLLTVATEVLDPMYLGQPFWTSSHFRKQNDASGWNPTPCTAR